MDLEQELRSTLGRKTPPAGFTARVLRRVERERTFAPPRWAPWAMAASLLIASFGGGTWYREKQQQARAEQAKDQILAALRVTSEKIGYVQLKVKRISSQE